MRLVCVGIILGSVVLFLEGAGAQALDLEDTWTLLNSEGKKAYQQRRYAQALRWFHQALSEVEKGESPDPRQAATLSNIAATHEKLGNLEQAKLHYRRSLTVIEAIQGPTHPDLIPGLRNMAILHLQHGELSQAERLYRRSLAIIERVLGEQHPHLIPGLLDLAHVSQVQEEYERTEEYYIRALKIGEAELPKAHHQTQSIRMQYAALLRRLNREKEAEVLEVQAQQALEIAPADTSVE